jgi:protein-disulfide isomerase
MNTIHSALVAPFLLCALFVSAQDASLLRPPKGSKVALVVFEDLQCPDCRRANPLLKEASKTYKIPLVRRDFPLPMHNWSMEAAITARYLDTHSERLGDAFRDYIFEHQLEITPQNLRAVSEKFAADNNVTLPFVVDPRGELAAKIMADKNLGQRVGISHTPTIYVVSSSAQGKPFVEVADRSQLFQLIEAMKRQ